MILFYFFGSREACEQALARLKDFLATINLSLNEAKTSLHDKDSEFTFLGVNFKSHELSIGGDKFTHILSKLTSSSKKPDITQSVENINAIKFAILSYL